MIDSSSRRLGVRLLPLLLLFPSAARADAPGSSAPPTPTTPPTEAQIEAAKAPYREARELERQGKTKEALERALDAYRTASTPVTALEAGQLLAQSGQLVSARDVLRGVALFPVSPRESDKGREARSEAATLAATLDSRIPKVALAARPANVEVALDGKPITGSDATAWQGVDPGPHTLVVRADGRVCTTINVTLTEAEARTIDLHDATAACRPEPPPAVVPAEPVVAPASRAADVPPAPASEPPTDTSSHPLRWAGVALGGAGVVAVGIGGYLALSAKSNYDGAASECPSRGCTQAGYDTRESARSRANAATVTMVVGAAAVAGGALLFFLPSGASSPHAAVGVGPGSVRLLFALP